MQRPTPRHRRGWMATIVAAVVSAAVVWGSAAAQAEEPVHWLTGDKLRTQLEQKVGATWSGIPLRTALASLSRSQRVAILLDRRVDPDQKIELALDDVTLDTALKSIAQRKQIGVAIVGSVVYFGPTATARSLRTLAALRKEDLARQPTAVRLRLLQSHPWRWNDLATPRELLAALAVEEEVTIAGQEQIPHDLWAAADLPPMNFVDRLTLLAGEFDLTFEFADDGQTVRLVAMPATAELQRTYSIPSQAAQSPRQIAAQLTHSLPDAHIELVGGKLVVRGRAEDHDFVEALLSGRTAKRTTVVAGQKGYTITIVMPVGQLIQKLGPMLALEVRLDEAAIKAAGLSLDTEVKVSVKNVPLDDLLRAVLNPAGLTFERHDKVIDVHPAKK